MSDVAPVAVVKKSGTNVWDIRILTMLFLGFSAGVPILLIFSSLSLWLGEAGVARATVTYFSWAALGYSFKFIWAPLVDTLPLPLLTRRLGRRRSWLLLAQLAVILAIVLMAITDPANSEHALKWMAASAVLLGFSSATQDIVIDAYRIESAPLRRQTMLSASYVAGYRIGMIVAGAGALFLASHFGSTLEHYDYGAWRMTYFIMAAVMLIGVITTLLMPEPDIKRTLNTDNHADHGRFFLLFFAVVMSFVAMFYFSGGLAAEAKLTLKMWLHNKPLASFLVAIARLAIGLAAAWGAALLLIRYQLVPQRMVQQTYVAPVQDFFQRYGRSLAWLLLALVGLYRISDIVLGVMSNVFYQNLGFTKPEIATVVKSFGLLMAIFGGFIGGILAIRFGVLRILLLGAILSSATNLLFMLLANAGHDMTLFYIVVSADNLASGLASAAFVAFLSRLTNIEFTAVQYAIFSSVMTLLPKVLGGYSGGIVDMVGYPQFFLMTALIGVPVIALILLAGRRFDLD